MGIPGLTGRVERHKTKVRVDELGKYTAIVDGPSLAYYVCEAIKIKGDCGSYRYYRRTAVKYIRKLLAIFKKVEFYFDGALPESKSHVRLSRANQRINNGFVPMLASTLLCDVLQVDFPHVETVIVADEADNAIACVVEDILYGPVMILSSDSDFYTYMFSRDDIYIMNPKWCDLSSVTPIIYRIQLQSGKRTLVEEALRKDPPKNFSRTNVTGVFPKAHELVNSNKLSERVISYLPIVYEDRNSAPAWECGRRYRAHAYIQLLKKFDVDTVLEYYRSGSAYLPKRLALEEMENIQELKSRENLIESIIDEVLTNRGPGQAFRTQLVKYCELVIEGHDDDADNDANDDTDDNTDDDIARTLSSLKYTLPMQQVFAKLQAVIYSLLLLQSTGVKLGIKLYTWHIEWAKFLACQDTN